MVAVRNQPISSIVPCSLGSPGSPDPPGSPGAK